MMSTGRDSLAIPLAAGLLFGVALERAKVYIPAVIQAQLDFTSFTMLKMFLAATTASMVAVALLEWFPSINSRAVKSPRCFGMGVHGYGNNLLGGAALGVGMAVSGACPGTLLAQFGAGLFNPWSLAGAVVGTLVVGPFSVWMQRRFDDHGSTAHPQTLDQIFARSFTTVGVAVGTAFLAIIAAAEMWIDWKVDLASVAGVAAVKSAWNPVVAGLLLGVLQLVLLSSREKMIGTSSGWATVLAEVAGWVGLSKQHHIVHPGAWWQVVSDFGIIAGARLSVLLSGYVPPPTAALSPGAAFVGAALILFGGRVAGGCASGHGLSGMSQLGTSSFVTVAAMFGGGILASLVV